MGLWVLRIRKKGVSNMRGYLIGVRIIGNLIMWDSRMLSREGLFGAGGTDRSHKP